MLKFLVSQCLFHLTWPNILRGRDLSRYSPLRQTPNTAVQ